MVLSVHPLEKYVTGFSRKAIAFGVIVTMHAMMEVKVCIIEEICYLLSYIEP